MIIRLALAVIILALIYWFSQKLKKMPMGKRRYTIIRVVFWAVVVFIIAAALTGRIHWLGALLAAAVGLLKFGFVHITRFLPFLSILSRQGTFSNPVFKTPHLELLINLQNGKISGKVIDGLYSGKNLSDLTDNDLNELENFYKDKDTRSYYLIRVIRQRISGHGSNESSSKEFSQTGDPSFDESLQILGLGSASTKEDVVRAHKQLIQKLHPDRGGNDYLASRVNQAKDVLLKKLNNP